MYLNYPAGLWEPIVFRPMVQVTGSSLITRIRPIHLVSAGAVGKVAAMTNPAENSRRFSRIACRATVGLALFFGSPVEAQDAVSAEDEARDDKDVVTASDDAFGRRVGVEQIGLYSESNVRGFSLQDAGNYRIDGSYFVRAAAPANPVISGTTTRVGINALRYDFPAPSGVVDFALRGADAGNLLTIETGTRPNSGPFTEIGLASASEDDGFDVVGGVHLYPWQTYSDGSNGDFYSVGLTPRWRPAPDVELVGLATRTWWRYEADVGYAVTGPFLPPRIERRRYLGQKWTETELNTEVLGAKGTAQLGKWTLGGSLFWSRARNVQGDFNLTTVTDLAGTANRLIFLVPSQGSRSFAGELTAARQWTSGDMSHRIIVMFRRRETRARIANGATLDLGPIDLFAPPPTLAEPPRSDSGDRVSDNVDQWTGGIGYRVSFDGRVEIRADLQRTHYDKLVRQPDGSENSNTTSPWLYSGSLAVALGPRTTAFASYSRGLEESGIAPGNAVNRNAVLPAVIATQAEIGLKQQLTRKLALIAGAFEIKKQVPGLGADGRFDLIGNVRHRGIEMSVAGAIANALNIVAGLTRLDATLSGERVDLGLIGRRAVGRPELLAQLNLSWSPPTAKNWSFDLGVTYTGKEQIDRANLLETEPFTVVNLGARYRWDKGPLPLDFRLRVTNVLNTYAWTATPSELLFYNPGRAVGLSVSTTL
jgi:iron complex outermembrane recepter protein